MAKAKQFGQLAVDTSALYREDATEEEIVVAYQHLINTGDAWRMEGSVGRTAMALLEAGAVMLGQSAHRDYWGNRVPSRDEVKAGTKGSYQLVADRRGEEHAKQMAGVS